MSFAAMCAIASSKHNAALTCGDPEYGFVALALKASVGKTTGGSNPSASAEKGQVRRVFLTWPLLRVGTGSAELTHELTHSTWEYS